jgi:hypothetical protein
VSNADRSIERELAARDAACGRTAQARAFRTALDALVGEIARQPLHALSNAIFAATA